MQCDENDILDYLKGWPNTYVSGKEIARKVGGKEMFEEDRGWAIPLLTQLVRRGIIETDHLGHYRLNVEEKKKDRREQHIAPQILNILKTSGKSFDGIEIEEPKKESSPIPAYPKSAMPATASPTLRAVPGEYKPPVEKTP
jgi:hypothetical protein